MTTLHLTSETTGRGWAVWPDPETIGAGEVHETGSYLFELRGNDATQADLLIDDQPLEALRARTPFTARWRWQPGFHAGSAEIELRIPGRASRRLEIVTDPDQRKLTRDGFDTMVREILDDTFALFSLSSFRKGIAQSADTRPPPVARLVFLRSRIEQLEEAVARIAARPRRYLAAREGHVPYHRASRATGTEILRSLRAGRVLRAERDYLPSALRGFLPEQILIRQRHSSLDIPEHREMAACLVAWAAWLLTAAGALDRAGTSQGSDQKTAAAVWATRCRRLVRRLTALSGASPFAEAGPAPARLTLTALFRNDPEYRRFYRLWQDMNRGIARVFGSFLDLPLARTFELYELWCYLRLVRAAAEEFGPVGLVVRDLFLETGSGAVTIANGGATVRIGEGWNLCFQRQYREFWKEPGRRGSYSRVMTPDIVVSRAAPGSIAEKGRLIVLDAKYRINEGLNDALSSIHTYRDALVEEMRGDAQGIVAAAYLLAPHLPGLGQDYRQTEMPGRLFHPVYRQGFRFGAVTMKPGMTIPEIQAALRSIVADAGLQS